GGRLRGVGGVRRARPGRGGGAVVGGDRRGLRGGGGFRGRRDEGGEGRGEGRRRREGLTPSPCTPVISRLRQGRSLEITPEAGSGPVDQARLAGARGAGRADQ